jgi:hypothetical protein
MERHLKMCKWRGKLSKCGISLWVHTALKNHDASLTYSLTSRDLFSGLPLNYAHERHQPLFPCKQSMGQIIVRTHRSGTGKERNLMQGASDSASSNSGRSCCSLQKGKKRHLWPFAREERRKP